MATQGNEDDRAVTWESGPSDPPTIGDGPGTVVSIDIAAPVATVWKLVTDISFGAAFSEEFNGARWADGVDGPALGAEFIGNNTNDTMGTWDVPCFVHRYLEHKEFGWATSDPDNPGARWLFGLEPIELGTRLTYSLRLGPGPSGLTAFIETRPELEARAIISRIRGLRQNMQSVVEGMSAAANAGNPGFHP